MGVGYWKRPEVQKQIADWMDVAVAYNESFNIKVARFGDNMRNVGVTKGDPGHREPIDLNS
nr:hypothetical protein [Fredinandcohnia onubensis]